MVLLFLFACARMIQPSQSFESSPHPPDVNYADRNAWAALPDRKDTADEVPAQSDLRDEQDKAAVDIFFIYPTTYYGRDNWNADALSPEINKRTDNSTIRQQGSIFNCCGKIYAPRYRQATLYSFIDKSGNGTKALNLAYSDVRKAFEYYLAHFNQGRPIVIASHSQGTRHAMLLLKEKFDGTPLQHLLVAAYIVGGAVPRDQFRAIPACSKEDDTGCFVTWNTMGEGGEIKYNKEAYANAVCTNPLSWRLDEVYVPREKNLGGVSKKFLRIDRAVTDARCEHGLLWITEVHGEDYVRMPGKSYHVADYSLYYMNVRENVRARVAHYLLEPHN